MHAIDPCRRRDGWTDGLSDPTPPNSIVFSVAAGRRLKVSPPAANEPTHPLVAEQLWPLKSEFICWLISGGALSEVRQRRGFRYFMPT